MLSEENIREIFSQKYITCFISGHKLKIMMNGIMKALLFDSPVYIEIKNIYEHIQENN